MRLDVAVEAHGQVARFRYAGGAVVFRESVDRERDRVELFLGIERLPGGAQAPIDPAVERIAEAVPDLGEAAVGRGAVFRIRGQAES